jgi:nitrogen regulatory protein P-II 1
VFPRLAGKWKQARRNAIRLILHYVLNLAPEKQHREAVLKKIEAYIQPFKLDEVTEALYAIGILGLSVAEVRGHGRQKGHTEVYRGAEYKVDLVPKIKLEVVVPPNRADQVVNTISSAARTGKLGDGKIFVSDIAEAVRIRNDERGESIL